MYLNFKWFFVICLLFFSIYLFFRWLVKCKFKVSVVKVLFGKFVVGYVVVFVINKLLVECIFKFLLIILVLGDIDILVFFIWWFVLFILFINE